jgi:hypothetical protein
MNFIYEIRDTRDFGKGIFILEEIKVGSCVWFYKLNENVFEYDEEKTIHHLNVMNNLQDQQHFLDITFGKNDMLCLITDDGKYMNHADKSSYNFNCKTDLMTGNCYALRDIKIGEQLFEDYSTFSHPEFLYILLKKYNCEPNYYNYL